MGQEAQRIMAASMNKIACSRNRRTGVDLHRNLLITTVLHKARNIFMRDSFQTKEDEISESECRHNAEELSRECREDEVDFEEDEDDITDDMNCDLSQYPVSQVPLNSEYHRVPEYTQQEMDNLDAYKTNNQIQHSHDVSDLDTTNNSTQTQDCQDQSLECAETFKEDEEPVLYTLLPAKSRDLQEYRSRTYTELEESRFDSCEAMRVCSKRHYEEEEDEVFESKKFKTDYPHEDFEDDGYQVSHLVNIFNSGFATLTGKELSCSITLKEASLLNEEFTSSLSRPILAMAMV